MRTSTLILIAALVLTACTSKEDKAKLIYPQSKVWAHRVNDTTTAKDKSKLFGGMEIDLHYEETENALFVGHDTCETNNKITFQQWLEVIDNPQ